MGAVDLGRLVGIGPPAHGALVTVLLYTGYLILRAVPDDERVGRLSAVYNVFAFVMLAILLPRHGEPPPRQGRQPRLQQLRPRQQSPGRFLSGRDRLGALYWMYTLRLRMNRVEHRLLTK